jgi:pilus assembly protein Flp/PilA
MVRKGLTMAHERFLRFVRNESAATAIEYALIAGFIGLVIIGSLQVIGTNLLAPFTAVATGLK